MSLPAIRIRIPDLLGGAERDRRLRRAGSTLPRSIDAAPLKGRPRSSPLRLAGGLHGARAAG